MARALDDLRERLVARQVILVAGSGVSMAASGGDPRSTWQGLIRTGLTTADKLPRASRRRLDPVRWLLDDHGQPVDSEDLNAAAEIVTQALGGRWAPEYRRWLRDEVGRLELRDASVPRALAGLGAPIATTNYDDLIEQAIGLEGVTWTSPEQVEASLLGMHAAVVHLHGYWREPASVLLGAQLDEALRADRTARVLQQAIGATRSLLLVGTGDGLEDPNFAVLRRWLLANFSRRDHRHFRLCVNDEADRLAREDASMDIIPIAYGDDPNALAAYLTELAPSHSLARGLPVGSASTFLRRRKAGARRPPAPDDHLRLMVMR
jgi:hypothetical protein